MVEVGPSTRVLGPAAIVVLLVLAVAGAVADGGRGDAGYPSRAAPGASVAIGLQATHTGNTAKPTSFALDGTPCATA